MEKNQRPYLDAANVKYTETETLLLVHESQRASIARLRLYGNKVNWIYDTYPFPSRRFKPFNHQRVMVDLTIAGVLAGGRMFNLSGMATGKTAGVVWALHALFKTRMISSVLILTTKSTVNDPWVNTCMDIMPAVPLAVLSGTKARKLKALEGSIAQVFIANHHTANTLKIELAKRCFDLVVIDEATVIKTASSVIHKSTKMICERAKGVIQLTGTPTANNLLDAHGQLLMGRVPGVPTAVSKFKMEYGFPVGPFNHVWFGDARERIQKLMFPSVAFKKEECIDLPPQIYLYRDVGMSDEQERAYNDLVKEYVYEHKTAKAVHVVTAVNALALMTKLLQVACGVVIGRDDESDKDAYVIVHPEEKLEELYRAIDQTERKVLIFAPYKAVIANLSTHLSKRYGEQSVALITGDTVQKERDMLVAKFQTRDDPLKILIAHPQVLAMGVTLTEADVTVWFGNTMRTELYIQGCERINRPGQTADKTIQLHILCSDIERQLYERQKDKIAGQEVMLEAFRKITHQHGLAIEILGRD